MKALLRIEHLEPWPDVTPEDEVAFDGYCRELTVGYALPATLVLAVCVLLWWPIDLLVAHDELGVQNGVSGGAVESGEKEILT